LLRTTAAQRALDSWHAQQIADGSRRRPRNLSRLGRAARLLACTMLLARWV